MELRNAKCWCFVFDVGQIWLSANFLTAQVFSYGSTSGMATKAGSTEEAWGFGYQAKCGRMLRYAKVVGNCGKTMGKLWGKNHGTPPQSDCLFIMFPNCCLNGGIPFFQAHHPSFRRTQIDKNIQTRVSKLCFTCLTQFCFSRQHVGRLKGLLGPKKTGKLDKTKSSETPFIHCLPWHLGQGGGKCPIWKIDLTLLNTAGCLVSIPLPMGR
jgi:hypothetical protein